MTLAVTHASALLPGLQLGGVSANATVSGIVTLSAQASSAGLSSVQFQVSGSNVGPQITSGSCSTGWDTRSLSDGPRTVTVIGRDSAGNTVSATPVVVNVRNSNTDTNAPTVSVSSPSSGSVLSGTVTMSASASDNVGVAGVWFTLDGSSIGTEATAAPFQVAWTTTSAANGAHTLRAVARDAAGNATTSSPVTVTINNTSSSTGRDTVAPTVSVTAPAAGATLAGTVTLSATATDNVGVVGVQFTVDGVNVGSELSRAPYTLTGPIAAGLTGSHLIRAVARDAAGNVTTSAAVTVSFGSQPSAPSDKTAPTVTLTSPAYGANVRGSVTLTATASDNVGVTSVRFLVDGKSIGTGTGSRTYQLVWNTSGVGFGHHVVQAVATDAAGNVTTSSSLIVFVTR